MATEAVVKATDVRVSTCTLISPTGTTVSLTHVLTELNIFEDMFSSTMTGNMLITDSLNLINKIPIVGAEYLLLSFDKPGSNIQFKKVFRIYKITDRFRQNQQTETYILHFVSEELLLSESLLVSKSYFDKTISSIVEDIAKQYLHIDSSKLIPGAIQTTRGLHRVIIPAWHPFHAINWLAKRAISEFKGASFVWYEDREGYHFNSIEYLMTQSSIQSIRVVPKNAGFEKNPRMSDLQISQEGVEVYRFSEAFDILRNVNTGMYSSELISYDPLRRRIQTNTLSAPDFFKNTQHTGKYPFILNSKDRLQRTLFESSGSHRKVYPMIGDKNNQRSNMIDQWLLQRDMYLANMHGIRMTAVLPGTPNLRVGKTVDVFLPSSEEQKKGGKLLDQIYSGKYIITALRHKIDQSSYACILELSKDALQSKLPEPQQLNSVDQIKAR